jgi:hypothetical protein
MRPMVVMTVAFLVAGQACFAADALRFHIQGLDLNTPGAFGTPGNGLSDENALLQPGPVDPAEQKGIASPSLNFGSFQAGIGSGWYQFDAKNLGATSVHGNVGAYSTQLLLTFPTH